MVRQVIDLGTRIADAKGPARRSAPTVNHPPPPCVT